MVMSYEIIMYMAEPMRAELSGFTCQLMYDNRLLYLAG